MLITGELYYKAMLEIGSDNKESKIFKKIIWSHAQQMLFVMQRVLRTFFYTSVHVHIIKLSDANKIEMYDISVIHMFLWQKIDITLVEQVQTTRRL